MTTETKSLISEKKIVSGAQQSEIEQEMPEPLRVVCRENPHLFEYIAALPLSDIGMPEYVT